jgi:hypothetical protein
MVEIEIFDLMLKYSDIENSYTELEKKEFMVKKLNQIDFDSDTMKRSNLMVKDIFKKLVYEFKRSQNN